MTRWHQQISDKPHRNNVQLFLMSYFHFSHFNFHHEKRAIVFMFMPGLPLTLIKQPNSQ